jgi:hypothetical protein
MSSRRSVRQVLVAVLLGVLVGGGLMAVTPAGAEVSSAVATNWKKIWKKNLKPLADKRYYSKKQSNARYQPKGSYETAGSGYTKAESDAKYAPYPKTLRGTYLVSGNVPAAGDYAFGTISYGVTLTTPPTTVFVPAAGPANPNCAGSAAAPAAAAGYLCVYEGAASNSTGFLFASATGSPGVSSPFGVNVRITSAAAGLTASLGGWALTPAAGGITPKIKAPGSGRGGDAFLGR